MTAEQWEQLYWGARRQVLAVLGAVDEVVPMRHFGMHPSLLHLHDMAGAMRTYLDVDAEQIDSGKVEV